MKTVRIYLRENLAPRSQPRPDQRTYAIPDIIPDLRHRDLNPVSRLLLLECVKECMKRTNAAHHVGAHSRALYMIDSRCFQYNGECQVTPNLGRDSTGPKVMKGETRLRIAVSPVRPIPAPERPVRSS